MPKFPPSRKSTECDRAVDCSHAQNDGVSTIIIILHQWVSSARTSSSGEVDSNDWQVMREFRVVNVETVRELWDIMEVCRLGGIGMLR